MKKLKVKKMKRTDQSERLLPDGAGDQSQDGLLTVLLGEEFRKGIVC